MDMVPVIGFAPDKDPTTPGALIDCNGIVPTVRGVAQLGGRFTIAGGSVPAGTVRGGFSADLLDGSNVFYAGTTAKLYQRTSGAWFDVSRGGGYTLGTDDLWTFCQFGNDTLAANLTCKIQRYSGGSFADIADAPQAKTIVSASGFVVAFNTIDATYGTSTDRWWCSAHDDATSWTPSLSTEATTGRLIDKPGPLVAAAALGDQIVAYKASGLWVGQYVGSPAVWQWNHYPGTVGVVGPNAVANAEFAHFFASRDDIYLFDGTRPVSVADGFVRQYYRDNLSTVNSYKTIVRYEKPSNLLWVIFPLSSAPTTYIGLVYHVGSKRWGKVVFDSYSILTAFDFKEPGSTLDSKVIGYADSAGNLYRINDKQFPWGDSSVTLNMVGADDSVSRLSRVYTSFTSVQNTTNATTYKQDFRHSTPSLVNSAVAYSNGKYDVQQSARWHRVQINMVNSGSLTGGVTELTGFGFDLKPAGQR